jgi:multiple antibiotic resistance protein
MTIFSAAMTLILVMDPIGNIPAYLAILSTVDTQRRAKIILRESLIAFITLAIFLFAGNDVLQALNISEPALDISGGIILFLIAIKMIFPPENGANGPRERPIGEPFIVPLAIPLVAGPSALTTVILLGSQEPTHMLAWFTALTIAAVISTITLLFASQLRKWLGQKGIIAMGTFNGHGINDLIGANVFKRHRSLFKTSLNN